MVDAEKRGGDAPDGRSEPEGGTAAPTSSTPAAEDVKRQDKTKDKADSDQNEDG